MLIDRYPPEDVFARVPELAASALEGRQQVAIAENPGKGLTVRPGGGGHAGHAGRNRREPWEGIDS